MGIELWKKRGYFEWQSFEAYQLPDFIASFATIEFAANASVLAASPLNTSIGPFTC